MPEIISTESASTSSLIDVDLPSVHTVPSDFADQEIQTETQAKRLEREAKAAEAKAEQVAKKASKKVKKADNWLSAQFAKLSDEEAGGVAIVNLATLVGVSSFLGYKAWGLYDQGRLTWGTVGVGIGILAAVGATESFVATYLYKGKKKD